MNERESLRQFLSMPVGPSAEGQVKARISSVRFSRYLAEVDAFWLRALFPFVDEVPFRYWDDETLEVALSLLERDPARTREAINAWTREMSVGLDAFFLTSEAAVADEEFTVGVEDMVRLATVYHPEYLRYAEHIYGNLISLYWVARRKGGLRPQFNLRSATDQLAREGFERLTRGFDERIRNAVAHGQIRYKGFEIQYGPDVANYTMHPSDFLSRFDQLVRTSNALVIGLILFLGRNPSDSRIHIPARLLTFLGRGAVNEKFAQVIGSFESEPRAAGPQLHVGLRANFRSREVVLYQCAKLAFHIIDLGAAEYSRFLFEIDHGTKVKGLVIVDASTLAKLLSDEAPVERLRDAFPAPQLLWETEWRVTRFLRLWRVSAQSQLALHRISRDERLPMRSNNAYWIRHEKNISVRAKSRLEITAVLRDPLNAENPELLRQLTRAIIQRGLKRWVRTRYGGIGKQRGWGRHPRQIIVKLYRVDGPLRWLGRDGWTGGNLLLVAEYIHPLSFGYQYVAVDNPQEIWKGIRFRYEMDEVWYQSLPQHLKDALDNAEQDRKRR